MSSRIVYSTGVGRVCPGCGWPDKDCRCSKPGTQADAVPDRITAKLRMERAGRGGKTVTVVDGLPRNQAFLDELATTLKRACGVGGTVREGSVELAGDVCDRVRPLLAKRGWTVKG